MLRRWCCIVYTCDSSIVVSTRVSVHCLATAGSFCALVQYIFCYYRLKSVQSSCSTNETLSWGISCRYDAMKPNLVKSTRSLVFVASRLWRKIIVISNLGLWYQRIYRTSQICAYVICQPTGLLYLLLQSIIRRFTDLADVRKDRYYLIFI